MRYFSSDFHFSHKRVIDLVPRPFKDINEMDETIIRNWNAVVKPDDWGFALGDIALGTIAESLPKVGRMTGIKVCQPGNHDRIFSEEPDSKIERFWPEYLKVFQHIAPQIIRLTLSNGQDVMLSHFPYDGDSHDEDRWTEVRPFDFGLPLIHGHTHSSDVVTRSKQGTPQIHVGVDAWNYRPVSEDKIIKILEAL